jgi:hypothetical protein
LVTFRVRVRAGVRVRVRVRVRVGDRVRDRGRVRVRSDLNHVALRRHLEQEVGVLRCREDRLR